MPVEIVVNGEARDVPEGLTVVRLLEHLELGGRRVAVEVNREIVRRESYAEHPISAGDQIEIVHFVGGG